MGVANTNRTDPHRKGAIIPAHYSHVLSYDTGGMHEPAFAVACPEHIGLSNEDLAKTGRECCLRALHARGLKFSDHGGRGNCTACGARFREGDVWRHESGEHIHLGHDCAAKYEMLIDRSEYEMARGRALAARAVEIEKARKAQVRAAFLAEHPGLAEALDTDHRIVRDIKARFVEWCKISDKQIELVRKLHAEAQIPAEDRVGCAEPPAVPVPASAERQTFQGRVLTTAYGTVVKMLVQVRTPDGAWKGWGTVPAGARDLLGRGVERGDVLPLAAGVEVSDRDPAFGFLSRPTIAKAKPVKKARKTAGA